MDDLLDLEWDKKPTATSNGQSQSAQSSRNGNISSYSFDALTRSLPQTQQSSINRSGSATPSGVSGRPQQQSSSDAFSSLLGFDNGKSSSSSTSSNVKISMAERLRKEQEQKLGFSSSKSNSSSQTSKADNSAWEGLDSLLGSSSKTQSSLPKATSSHSKPSSSTGDDDLWNFTSQESFQPVNKPTPRAAPGGQAQRVETTSSSKAKKAADPFDFSDFEDPGESQSSALGGGGSSSRGDSAAPPCPRQPSHQLMNNSDDDDDILGLLGRNQAPTRPIEQHSERPKKATPVGKMQSRSISPPPHIIGQIVEMGFSPLQARKALAATESGLDVSAAIEMLVGEAGGNSQHSQDRDAEIESDRRAALRIQKEEERGNGGRNRRGPPGRRNEVDEEGQTTSGLDIPPEWQKQADQIYSQASEIGASMFNKANAFWSTAKAQAQRAIEERNNAGSESGQSSGRSSPSVASDRAKNRRWAVGTRDGGANQRKEWQGKPRWMIDAEEQAEAEERGDKPAPSQDRTSNGGFRDDDDDSTPQVKPFFERKQAVERPTTSPKEATRTKPGDLWDEAAPATNMVPPATTTSRRSSPLAGLNAASTPKAPSPAPRNTTNARKAKEEKNHRQLIQDSPDVIQSSSTHKQRGNEHFKKGAYGEAEIAYSAGLNALESNPASLRRIALLNNRASARLKNGDARSALTDTKDVLTLIVMGENKRASPFLLYRPSKEHALPLPEYAEINLREAYAKALLRRAQAEEMLEQWDTAKSVWSLLEKYEKEEGSGKSGMTNMRAAQDGSKRCNKMLQGGDVELSEPATKRVQAAAIQAVAKAERMAKERIRAENIVAAAEEAEKDSLRDSVDNRVLAWKNGKESNVRALLASLQDVVWPGLNWKRVGMHELVMDNQVKRCYMRAIGKLHPDKLTPKSNSIEERMIGGAVFSVLNDAWSVANAS